MKRNAIIRIVLWSLALVVLTTVLVNVLLGNFRSTTSSDQIHYRNQGVVKSATALRDTEIRTTPNETSSALYSVQAGEHLTVTRQEVINDQKWAYVSSPESGWVLEDDLHFGETAIEATSAYVSIESNEKYTFDPRSSRRLTLIGSLVTF